MSRVELAFLPKSLSAASAVAALIALLGWAAAAYAKTPVPYDQLQLDSPDATVAYGQATVTGTGCSASAFTAQTSASVSADKSGNGVLTVVRPSPSSLPNQTYAVNEVTSSELELDYSGSATLPTTPPVNWTENRARPSRSRDGAGHARGNS